MEKFVRFAVVLGLIVFTVLVIYTVVNYELPVDPGVTVAPHVFNGGQSGNA